MARKLKLLDRKWMYRHFIYSDAGWNETDEPKTFNGEVVGCCGVRTVAHAYNLSFKEAEDAIRKFEYTWGTSWVDNGLKKFFKQESFNGYRANMIFRWGVAGKTLTVRELIRRYPKGTYVLNTCTDFTGQAAHILCVRNGKILDTFAEDAWVCRAWEIVKI